MSVRRGTKRLSGCFGIAVGGVRFADSEFERTKEFWHWRWVHESTEAESMLEGSVTVEVGAGWVWAYADAGDRRSVGSLVATDGKVIGAAVIRGAEEPESIQ